MPHECVRCGEVYPNDSSKIIEGCDCGSKLFFYVKQEVADKLKHESERLSEEDRKQIEKDIYELIEETDEKTEEDPVKEKIKKSVKKSDKGVVVVDIESIKIIEPGKYEIDLAGLFKKKPPVYGVEDGKYVVDLNTAFEMAKKEKEEKKE